MNVKRKASILVFTFVTTLFLLSGCETRDQRVQDLMGRGDDHLKEHAYNYAIKLYDEVLKRDPDNEEAKYKKEQSQVIIDLANEFIAKGDEAIAEKRIDAAYVYFQQAADLFPYNEDNGYKRNLAVFEIDEIQYFLDQLTELDNQWKNIKENLNGGESLSSEKITKDITELYPLAQQVISIGENLQISTSSEATEFFNDNKPTMEYMLKEFIVYQIIPRPPMYQFEEADEYVVQVKQSIVALGLDFHYEEVEDYLEELFFINNPDLQSYRSNN